MISNWFVKKTLVKLVGLEPAFLLTYFIESDIKKDWFVKTQKEVEKEIGFARKKQENCIKKLLAENIIIQKNMGLPCKRYFKINYEVINNLK